MEYFKKILKKTGKVSILESIIFAVIGILLACNPVEMVNIVSKIIGGVFVIFGVIKIIKYFLKGNSYDYWNFDLIYGLTTVFIGIVASLYINVIGSLFRVIIAIWIVYTSFVRINASIQMKRVGIKQWIWSLIIAFIMFGCGLYILLNPGTIIATIGILMTIFSVLDIIENIIFMKNIDIIEVKKVD